MVHAAGGTLYARIPRGAQAAFADRDLQKTRNWLPRWTITAAEFLQVDAAIIFADLLLPLEVMGLPFHFSAGEGPVIEKPGGEC